MSAAGTRPLTGRHVLAIVLAFFGIVLAVNGIFVWLALGSWTGVATENAYVEGLRYGQTLRQAEAQRALGWRLHHVWSDGVLEVRLTDGDARPVAGLEVSAAFRRPTHEGEDASVEFARRGPGFFRSEALHLAPGQWDLMILVARGGETVYRREERIWIK